MLRFTTNKINAFEPYFSGKTLFVVYEHFFYNYFLYQHKKRIDSAHIKSSC